MTVVALGNGFSLIKYDDDRVLSLHIETTTQVLFQDVLRLLINVKEIIKKAVPSSNKPAYQLHVFITLQIIK